MEAAHPGAATVELSRHVHEAAEVAGKQEVGSGLLERLSLFLDDGVGDGRILYAEGPAEAAAHVIAFKLAQLQPVHGGEQLARLGEHAELTQARAGVMIGGGRL